VEAGGGLSPHEAYNRQRWDELSADYQSLHGEQLAKSGGTAWGVWQLPESELRVLGEVRGRDVLEFGCGAAQWSIALSKLGARVIGLDLSQRQLEHARALMAQAGVEFPLVCASAEATPFDDASFDIVFCDWGAMTFADPYRTVPEAARILRPGGLLAFLSGTPIVDIAWEPQAEHPVDRLLLDYWDLHELPIRGEPTMFQLPYGEWIRLFGEHGLLVESLLELRPPADATSSYRGDGDREWARRWPMEHIWRVRRSAAREPVSSARA
jgi:SAM-dependent methyltransferase